MCGCLQLLEVRRDFAIFEEGREGTGCSGEGKRDGRGGTPQLVGCVVSLAVAVSSHTKKKKNWFKIVSPTVLVRCAALSSSSEFKVSRDSCYR